MDSRIPDTRREFKRASPSQITTYRLCPRKWWFDKIAQVPRQTTEAMARGSSIHKLIEDYLIKREPFPDTEHGRLAAACILFLPAPGQHLEDFVERRFKNEDDWAVPMIGIIDLVEVQDGSGTTSPSK